MKELVQKHADASHKSLQISFILITFPYANFKVSDLNSDEILWENDDVHTLLANCQSVEPDPEVTQPVFASIIRFNPFHPTGPILAPKLFFNQFMYFSELGTFGIF